MLLVDFLRHGDTDLPEALLGRTDAALSERGWRQFERQTAGRDWGAIVTSPLRRAREAAERLAGERGVPIEIDADWREIDLGDWDGKPLADLRADAATAALLAAFYRNPAALAPPNGETFAAAAARVERALARLAARREPTLVVAHAGTIRIALSLALAIPIDKLWALKIACGTRVRATLGIDPHDGLWGEIAEITQP